MKRHILIVGFLIAFALAACGGSGAKTSHSVIMSDFSYSPDVIQVPAGQLISLELSNTGAVVHNFIIMKAGTDIGDDFGADDEANVYWKAELPAGQSLSAQFTAPSEPGEYRVVCSTPGHYLAGMTGKLVVVAP